MVKKRKAVSKKNSSEKSHKSQEDTRIEKALIENFVALQKVMVNLSSRFDNLSERISKLLDIFEISAKDFAEKTIDMTTKTEDTELLKKLDSLLEQNKIIARGLALLHEKPEYPQMSQPMQTQRQIMPTQFQRPLTRQIDPERATFQRSSNPQEQKTE